MLEINNGEDPGTDNKPVAQNWFIRFKGDKTSLENKPRLVATSIVKDEVLSEMIEQHPYHKFS